MKGEYPTPQLKHEQECCMSNRAQRVGLRGPYSMRVLYVPRDPTLSAILLIQHIPSML